ncbi:PIN domain-containing protein [Tunicatimonas pelagia]|uniref:PIN domain-containing protein n=1 Tax=Tunicatimonas pelagia TaxID=931531 RepID=UPI002665A9F1|nr:PIN domain-containing protein [Tunicatimonas pelagia]WKN40800.1 PIN domain-containing protein [Tunicatimonas pelagia]
MNKIFLDSDVLLDLLLDREPFADDIVEIIEDATADNVSLCVSPISITNVNYIIGKLENQKKADSQTKKILEIVKVENVEQGIITKAAHSKFKDFEDAVQNYCAEDAGHQIIITRNTKDYKESVLSILTPKEYLAKTKNE